MRLMLRVLVLFTATIQIAVAEHGMERDRLATLTSALDAYVAEGHLAGGVLHVVRRGEVVLDHAFGLRDIEQDLPMTSRSLHRIASQTKAFTSVAIMQLQEDGLLLIGDPVSKYLPEYASTTVAVADASREAGYRVEPAKRPITIRDLLNHTAGIDYGFGPAAREWAEAGIVGWYLAGDTEPLREKVARIAELPQAANPGERYVYGYGTDILGAVIEELSGQTLSEYLQARLFDPLAMRDTYFFVPPEEASRLATVYGEADVGIVRAPDAGQAGGSFYHGQGHYVDGPRLSHSGGAGAVSTARDYARFLEMLRSGGTLDGVRILGRKTIEHMIVDHLPQNVEMCFGPNTCLADGFGLGFSITEDLGASSSPKSIGSYGWGGAYHSTYWVDPVEELTVVYLTQLIPATRVDDHAKITALIYSAIAD